MERSQGGDREGVGSSAGQGSPCGGWGRRSYFRGMLDHFQGKLGSLLDTMDYLHGRREYPCGSLICLLGMMEPLQDMPAHCQGKER